MNYRTTSRTLSSALFLLALLPLAGSPQSPSTSPGPAALTGLSVVLDTGRVLQDRNQDRVVDFLHLRILLPRDPEGAEVAAAANLAARFGFETSATNLGLAASAANAGSIGAPVLLIGSEALNESGVFPDSGGLLDELAPGQGMVVHLPPGGALPGGGVATVGYDATGLLSAAGYLSSRYPGVWTPEGPAWTDVVEKLRAFLDERGWEEATVTLDRIVVDARRPGVARARVSVELPARAHLQAVLDALRPADTRDGTGADTPDVGGADTAGGTGADILGAEADTLGATEISDLEFRDLHRLDVRVAAPGEVRTVTLRPREPWGTREATSFRAGADATFSLPDLYAVGGLYRDTNRDLVPDETAAFLSLSGGDAPDAVVDLATRVGLETAGIRLPLARIDGQEDDPADHGFPVFVGTDHYQIHRLLEEEKLPARDVDTEEGFVRFVEGAFGDRNALVVGGGSGEGLHAVTDWLARRAPYLWRYGKGEYGLRDVETETRRFLQARKGPGQVALALTKLGRWMDRMADDPPDRIQVEMATLQSPPGLASVAESMVRERLPDADVEVESWATGFGVGDTVFVQEWDIPWEVDDARELLEGEVYPELRDDAPVHLDLRLSEPPEVRAALEEEIRSELSARGVEEASVHVLSAYKQGYSWIHDVLLPRLRELDVASVDLTYHTLEESEEIRWQTVAAETRWLQEIYPFDAVLARELGISDSAVVFHPTREKDPIYTFEARNPSGEVVLRETFDPRYVVRPFFDLFPEYEQVRVTTGWLTARQGADTLVDRRIVTDPERFWDRLQTETFQKLIDYIMDTQDGNPSGDNAPFFDEFRVDLRMSEPDYRIGIDEETISSLEALHEDIFFETHTLFSLIGGRYQTSLSYPGRVLPFVDPTGAGEPGRARIVLTGKSRANPELVVRSWNGEDSEPLYRQYELTTLPTEDPALVGASVRAGEEGLSRVTVRVTVPDSVDRYEEFRERSSERAIDAQFLNVQLLEGMVSALGRLHEAGLMQEALSWDRVGALALDFRLEDDSTYRHTVLLPRSRNPASTDNPRLEAEEWSHGGERIVQWETPMPPEESNRLLARLGTFPEVRTYYLTDTYLGRPVWAADFLPPHQAEFISQAKLNAFKPTLFVSGREHANEVSSTNHILRLGELLVTDSTYRSMLDEVNVVLHPVTNPDGAALAYERQLVNPDHMLHAARPGALGVDATRGATSRDPIYPEARARTMLRQAWLPDIYLNPHGYPSHEWVQYFAGYSAWVRGRRVGPRDWWVPRGWFIPGFGWVDDEEHPEYRTAQFAILDSLAAAMTRDPEVDEVNRRLYARYKKYGEQDRDGFFEHLHEGMVVSMRLRGAESIGTGLSSPRITYFGVTTEAPDETARGDWMELMGRMGLAHTAAALRYLAGGEYDIEREVEVFDDAVIRKAFRVKPVLPPDPGDEDEPGG